jgi:hypothetical protein
MEVYARPGYYALSHFILGFVGAWLPWVLWLALIYQAAQLLLGVRFFPVERRIRNGNSVSHTGVKVVEILAGFIVGLVVKGRHVGKN